MSKISDKNSQEAPSWKFRGPVDSKAKSFVLAACGGDTPETYQKLRQQEGGEPDWEELAIDIALGHELSRQTKIK